MKTRRFILAASLLAGLALGGFWVLNRQAPVSELTKRGASGERAAAPVRNNATEPAKSAPAAASRSAALAGVDPLIQGICGPDAQQHLRELGRRESLTPVDSETLYRFLLEKTEEDSLKRNAWIKNEVMNMLARQKNLPAPWDQMLARVYEDEHQSWVIRDYALQHLFEFCEKANRSGELAQWSESRCGEIEELFWKALDQTRQSVAGTALLALWRLSETSMAVDRERVSAKAAELVEAADTGELALITALQVSAAQDEPRILKQAMTIAESNRSIALRASAIAAVGRLGGKAELTWLEEVAAQANPGLKNPVEAALKQIRSRIEG